MIGYLFFILKLLYRNTRHNVCEIRDGFQSDLFIIFQLIVFLILNGWLPFLSTQYHIMTLSKNVFWEVFANLTEVFWNNTKVAIAVL